MMNYVSLKGSSRENVFLDAEKQSQVILFNKVAGSNLSDLTVTSGKGGEWPTYGGGINCLDSDPVFTNLTISNNASESYSEGGGGVYCSNSDLVFINVDIMNNTATQGGGIFCNSDCDLTLRMVSITGNIADEGGGIYSKNKSSISMHNCTLSGNTASETGGAAYFRRATAELYDLLIFDNVAKNGGGLCFFSYTTATLKKAILKNNSAGEKGGGIYTQGSDIYLTSVSIFNNTAGEEGGGMFVTGSGTLPEFDSIERCNIYLNEAPMRGRDIASNARIAVIVDTFTVLHPIEYFAYPMENFTFDILHGMIKQEDADLYVSPQGDNLNSGLTSDEPLKNIDVAIIKIIPDTTQRTIHLMEGIYSNSGTDEIFPLFMPEYIDIVGVSKENVVLDAEGQSDVVYFDVNNQSKLSTLTVKGGKYNGIHCYHSTPVLEDLLITENIHTGISFDNNAHATLNNISITNNAGKGLVCLNSSSPVIDQLVVSGNEGWGISLSNSSPIITNATISNNAGGISCSSSSPKLTDITISDNKAAGGEGGGIDCINSYPEINNAIISGNTARTGGGIYCSDSKPKLTDVTIMENESYQGGGIYLMNGSVPSLGKTDIIKNKASYSGGGIYADAASSLLFDSINRCNIYMNSAIYAGNDLYSEDTLKIVVDTFTVMYPTDYHASPIQNFSFNILHGLLEQVDADLFVSPDGDNDNNGLTAEEPLKNIRYGYAKLIADSLNPRTVHLMEGVYSPSKTGEVFPLSVPRFINLSGVSQNDVILDAEKQSGVIYVYDKPDAKISGLTVTNGSNSGIKLSGSHTELKNLTIRNNDGSGIFCGNSDTSTLINVSIYNNQNYNRGGGIFCRNGSYLIFDKTERCNIYNNRAKYNGNDLYTESYFEIFADTFSVLNPKNFHASPIDSFAFDINYGRFEQTSEDLYVSPDGDNLNSGLTADNPIRNIHIALSKSLADSLHPQTFHLAEGVYSPSASNESYPVMLDDYISLEGAGAGETILDADSLPVSVIRIDEKKGINISKLTITGGGASGVSCSRSDPVIQNVRITGNSASYGGGIHFNYSNPVLKNVVIDNNTAGCGWDWDEGGGGIYFYYCNPTLLNVSILNNVAACEGGGIFISPTGWPDNVCHTKIINSIIWNNSPDQAYVDSWSSDDSTSVNISWSNIMNGEDGIVSWDTTAVHWLEGNVNEDPLFVNIGNFPYALSDDSPCIDAGTPDTTGLNLPEIDIFGNPRIWNDRIDMGAVEWNSLKIEEFEAQSPKSKVWNYPNPFTTSTTIEYELEQPANVQLIVYNHLGERVGVITEQHQPKGKHRITRNFENLPSGVYYCVLKTEGGMQTMKMIKLK